MTNQRETQQPTGYQHEGTSLILPFDYPIQARAFRFAVLRSGLEAGISHALQAAAEGNGRTATLGLAAYAAWLHRMSGETDIAFDTAAEDGRRVTVMLSFDEPRSFESLGAAIAGQLEAGQAAAPGGDSASADASGEESAFALAGPFPQAGNRLLAWELHLSADGAAVSVRYDESMFREATVQRFIYVYSKLLEASLRTPGLSAGAVDIITPEEQALYIKLNATSFDLPQGQTFHGCFEQAADAFGERTAISSPFGSYTYAQLNAKANRLAHALIAAGLHKGDFVTLFMERSLETVISLLAAMKAGGVYVPVDPEHPEDRIRYMIEDTQAPIVLTKAAHRTKAETLTSAMTSVRAWISVDDDSALSGFSDANPDVEVLPSDLAYLIYTSGSTGKPKGTMIPHEGAVNLGFVIRSRFAVSELDVLPQFATYSFDASVFDTLGALFNGAHLYLLSAEERISVEAFASAVEREGITKITVLPTVFFNQLASHLSDEGYKKLADVKLVMVGGEALYGEQVRAFQRKFGDRIDVFNLYGPTECSVVATMHKVNGLLPADVTYIPIGRPIDNYRVYVGNSEGQLSPVHVPGELYISTIGIAAGYLNQPEKTKQAFIDNPFEPGGKVYRSGDIVKLLEDGSIEYVGRRDTQVKIRGHRIEIGAIEDTIAQFPNVRDAAVIAVKTEGGQTELIGYFTTADGGRIANALIKAHLNAKLPSYYVPRTFCQVAAMPLSPSGKIDRRKLATYELPEDTDAQTAEAEPLGPMEQRIAEVWKPLLRTKSIRKQDDFFDLGGNSLNVIQVLVQLKPQFPALAMDDLFEHKTIDGLARYLTELDETARSHSASSGEVDAAGSAGGLSFNLDLTVIEDWDGTTYTELTEHPNFFFPQDSDGTTYRPPSHVLLTGGTGFLGSRILYDLLRQTEARVYALVRGPEPGIGKQRLWDIMRHYFGEEGLALMENRVIAVEGNLDQPELCVHAEDYGMLQERIDTIVHAAADVRHFGDRRKFQRTNIEGTASLLKLAASKPGVRFHHISTIGIPDELATAGLWEEALRHDSIPEDMHCNGVYTESKLEAEKLVLEAARQGLAVTIYRPGNLTCDSQTGGFQRNIDGNAFYRMLKAMLLLGRAPTARWQVDFTPIDYAGQAILALMMRPDTVGHMFHIVNPNPLPYETMLETINGCGYSVEIVAPRDYVDWLLDPSAPKSPTGVELGMTYLEGDGAKDSRLLYGCRSTVAFLEGTGVACPSIDEDFIRRMFAYAASVGYFPQPNAAIRVGDLHKLTS